MKNFDTIEDVQIYLEIYRDKISGDATSGNELAKAIIGLGMVLGLVSELQIPDIFKTITALQIIGVFQHIITVYDKQRID